MTILRRIVCLLAIEPALWFVWSDEPGPPTLYCPYCGRRYP